MEVSKQQKAVIEKVATLSGMDEEVIRSELRFNNNPENPTLEELREALVKYLEQLDQEMQDQFVS